MLKKKLQPSYNINESVKFILRGAKKRRQMALMTAKEVNSETGIRANLTAVK